MTIRWITPLLGTAAFSDIGECVDLHIIDVRDLVDKAGNTTAGILPKIREGVELLGRGRRVVVCCDYGMSRSNSIAVGILSEHERVGFQEALRRVQAATGETEIKLEPLQAVRAALRQRSERLRGDGQRPILVTGSTGFLGRRLLAAIGGEFRVIAPKRADVDVALGSTKLLMLADEEDVECVIHLANPRIYTSNMAMGGSITMLRNVVEVCLGRSIPLIYPSSWEIYAGYAGTLVANEATPAFPKGPCSETKFLSEILLRHCSDVLGLSCAILRFSPVYGPGGDKPKFLYNFLEKARRNEKIVTHEYRNGKPALDLLHVDDVISALMATVRSGFRGTVNIGTSELTSTDTVARMLVNRIGSSSVVEKIAVDADTARIAMSWHRAEGAFGWRPTKSFEDGLNNLLPTLEVP